MKPRERSRRWWSGALPERIEVTSSARGALSAIAALALACAALSGCNLVLGIQELPEGTGGAGGGATTGTGASGGATTASTTTTATTCKPNETPCGAACADLTVSPTSCGACGHDCQGGGCVDSECQPVVVAAGLKDPFDIAIAGSSVFVTSFLGGDLVKVPLLGTNAKATTLVPSDGQTALGGIAVDDTDVYWGTSAGDIRKISQSGGQPSTIASGQGGLLAVAVAGDSLYWVTDTAVKKAPKAGGAEHVVATLSAGQGPASDIAIDAGWIYWSYAGAADGAVFKAPLGDGAVQIVASMQVNTNSVAVDATGIYWGNGGSGNATGSILKATLDGMVLPPLATGQDNPNRVRKDGGHVYWTNATGGTVMRAPESGGDAKTIASTQVFPRGLAIAPATVVWTARGTPGMSNGSILRLAK
jgi:hypothetical protein